MWLACRHRLEYLAFRAVTCLIDAVSPRTAESLAHALAWLLCHAVPRRITRYHIAQENLRLALGSRLTPAEIDRIIFRMWVHLFRLVVEIVQLPRRVRLENVVDTIAFRAKADVVRALSSGRPVLLLSGHYGNWEMAVSVFGLFGFRLGVVARTLDNPLLERWFARFRQYTGHRALAKKGSYDDMLALLQRGGALALLADQDAGRGGVFVDFFGRPASTHKSIALLALEYRAVICVGYARRLEHERLPSGWPRYELGCEAVIDPSDYASAPDPILAITQAYAHALERVVRRAPEQYFWVHRRWKTPPAARTRKRIARKAG